jgi:hypothetical protein
MEFVRVVDIVGDKCTGYPEGKMLFDVLDGFLSKGATIEVDMAGITFSSSSFYNAAFGELVIKYDINFLKDKLHFKNFSAKDKFLFSKTISLARKMKEEVA